MRRSYNNNLFPVIPLKVFGLPRFLHGQPPLIACIHSRTS